MSTSTKNPLVSTEPLPDAEKLALYLNAGVLLIESAHRSEDIVNPSRGRVVPEGTRSDGTHRWGVASAWYVEQYGYDPTGRLAEQVVAHIRKRGYEVPTHTASDVAAIKAQFAKDLLRVSW